MNTRLTPLSLIICLLLFMVACNKNKKSPKMGQAKKELKVASNGWSPGDCIDKALSPYVYQIADIEGDTFFLYPMGKMGKDIVKKTLQDLKSGNEPFKKVACP